MMVAARSPELVIKGTSEESGRGIMDSFLLKDGTYDNHPEHLSQSPFCSKIPTTQVGSSEGNKQKRARTKNFSSQEDMLLMSAWLNVSMDPVHGNNQVQQTYWNRIAAYFHEHKQFDSDRNSNSLMHRWSSIQLAVSKFQGYYNQIDARNQSEITEQDKVCQALEMYKSLQKSSFPYMHCWNELRYEPKFASNLSKKKNKKPQHTSPVTSSPSTPDSVGLNDTDEATLEQPSGSKAPNELFKKTIRKVQEAEDEYIKAIFVEIKEAQRVARNERIARVDELLGLEKERLEREKRKEEREQKQEERERKKEEREEMLFEQRILSTNTTNMDETEREYYSLLKASIMKKRRTTGFQL